MRTTVRPLALLAAALAVLAACSEPTPAPGNSAAELRVGPLTTQNTLTLATRGGALANEVARSGGSLQLPATFPAFAPAAQAMAAGQIDVTTGSATALIPALQGNPDLVVFAVEANDNDTQGIVAGARTGIASVSDLAGHTVAVNEGGTGDYLLRVALAQAGMDIDDVEPVYLSPPDAATAFAGGQVDAWATWDQYLVSAERLPGATLVALARDIGATNPTVHVVSRSLVTAHPDLVRALYRALEAQAEAVVASPTELEAAYRDAGAAPEVAAAIAAKRPPRIVPADDAFAEELAAVAQFYRAHGMTTTTTDVSQAVVDVRDLP